MPVRSPRGIALYAGVVAIAGLGVLWAGMSFRGARRPRPNPEPSPISLSLAMSQSGFGDKELAAAGVSANAVAGGVSAVRSAMIQGQIDFAQLGLDVASARQTVDRLESTVRSGNGSQETLASLSSARTSLGNAEARLAAARAAIRDAVASVLPESAVAKLDTIRASGTDLPLKYRVVARSEAQTLALRDAIANQRIAAACGEEGHAGCAQAVASAGSDAEVATADVALATSGAEVTAAWKQATGIQ